MIAYRYTIIAKEGWLPIAIGLTAAILLQMEFGWYAGSGVWVLVAVMAFVYRDPPRKVPASPLGIVAPVDGVVIAVREGTGPYLKRQTIAVSIKANSTGVYSVRSPTEGKVVEQWFGLPPNDSELISVHNKHHRQFAQWIKTDEDDDIVFALRTKVPVGKYRCYVNSGERIGQGQRCCFVVFGADAEVLIPIKSNLAVKQGDIVKAGESILATLIH